MSLDLKGSILDALYNEYGKYVALAERTSHNTRMAYHDKADGVLRAILVVEGFDGEGDLASVAGHLFKPSGKWKYEVKLDYRGILDEDGKPPFTNYLCPNDAALKALRQATLRGTSGVTLEHPGGYHLVVTDPPNGYPVMVAGIA